jgi:hypothetical protein
VIGQSRIAANLDSNVVPAKVATSALTRVFDALWRPQSRDDADGVVDERKTNALSFAVLSIMP